MIRREFSTLNRRIADCSRRRDPRDGIIVVRCYPKLLTFPSAMRWYFITHPVDGSPVDGTKFSPQIFSVFELSPTGSRERLIARLSVFDDAKKIAELARDKPRVVVHIDKVVWPPPS